MPKPGLLWISIRLKLDDAAAGHAVFIFVLFSAKSAAEVPD
ncbi:hypothetical protein [Azospirillum endophyticum]